MKRIPQFTNLMITGISQAKRNPNNVHIELDNHYWITIDKNILLRYELHKGKQITEEEKLALEDEADLRKLLEKVYRYLGLRPRSTKEVYDYLKYKRQVDEPVINNVLQILKKRNVISDEAFAKWFIENRLSTGVHGKNKIRLELIKKGVNAKLIDALLKEMLKDEEVQNEQLQKTLTLAEKYLATSNEPDKYKLRNKLTQRLVYRGFDFDLIQEVMKELKNKL